MAIKLRTLQFLLHLQYTTKYIERFLISVHWLEKWCHFVSPKTLLCFRIRVRVGLGL